MKTIKTWHLTKCLIKVARQISGDSYMELTKMVVSAKIKTWETNVMRFPSHKRNIKYQKNIKVSMFWAVFILYAYLKTWLIVCVHFEHQPKTQVNLVGSREAGINIKHLLKCFNCPENREKRKLSIICPRFIESWHLTLFHPPIKDQHWRHKWLQKLESAVEKTNCWRN